MIFIKILIDGDSCCQKDNIIRIAKKKHIPVDIYCDVKHNIEDDYAITHIVDCAPDSTDIALANSVEPNDIVITNDTGLAALILAKKGYAINNYGLTFTKQNIQQLLSKRHIIKQTRRKTHRNKLHNDLDQTTTRHSFCDTLHYTIRKAKRNEKRKEM